MNVRICFENDFFFLCRDLSLANRVISQLKAGSCYVNCFNLVPPEVPFGGYKKSRFGRESGMAALNYYTQVGYQDHEKNYRLISIREANWHKKILYLVLMRLLLLFLFLKDIARSLCVN